MELLSNIKTNQNNTRHSGIELLRIIAMFFVITIHLMSNMQLYAINKPLFVFIRAFAFCAVPTFVITSGYFLVNAKFKINRICKLWLQVIFYSAVLNLMTIIIDKNTPFNISIFIKSFLPILSGGGSYWFVQAYFLLMIVSPFINIMLNNTTKKQHLFLILLIVLASFLGNNFSIGNMLSLNYGESMLWFCALYAIGAYLKKIPNKYPYIYSNNFCTYFSSNELVIYDVPK